MKQTEQPNNQNVADGVRVGESPVPGITLRRILRGHTDIINRIAWSPDGKRLASPSDDETVRIWDTETGECLAVIEEHRVGIWGAPWSPDGRMLASTGIGGIIRLWNTETWEMCNTLEAHKSVVTSLAWSPDGKKLVSGDFNGKITLWNVETRKAIRELIGHKGIVTVVKWGFDKQTLISASSDTTIRFWDVNSGKLRKTLEGHSDAVLGLALSPDGQALASAGNDNTIGLWDLKTGQRKNTLEGHTNSINDVSYSWDGRLLASKSWDNTVRLWRSDTLETIAILKESSSTGWPPGLAFHPKLPILATLGEKDTVIRIWDLDIDVLLGAEPVVPSAHYVNAKVILMGDTGVGKTGLGLVLTGQPFVATDSTPGRHVWDFESCEVELEGKCKQTRETLLWDLAGQPAYRLIHQLHLNEVAVALIVFDARSETDPLAGVRHWDRALHLARQRQESQAIPVKKFLVAARTDRGGVSVSKARVENLKEEFGFDDYFVTSAKEGWQIDELIEAIRKAVPWEHLPVVVSNELFVSIKKFILKVKKSRRFLITANDLFDDFVRKHPKAARKHENLRDQFDTCVGRMETRDLIRRLSFGGYILLQPELLDAYASAMVNEAKKEPDGLGSIAEEDALAGRFHVPEEQRIEDKAQEQLLLHATVEELVKYDLALRETADEGRYLVFPSQFNRDYEDAPEPKGKVLTATFEGPVQSVYSTLAVRLNHSGQFETDRTKMWRNAAEYSALAGGTCGIFLSEFAEARGRLTIFFDPLASDETRFHFEEYILAHLKNRVLEGKVEVIRFFVCPNCSTPVPDPYVKMLREQGKGKFPCPCGENVSIEDPKEKLKKRYPSKVGEMDVSADRKRDFEEFVYSAKAETRTKSFIEWAGGEHVTLAIAFTDVVGSTALGQELGDERMNEVRNAHFEQGRRLLAKHEGREIKTIGDSFMAAFQNVGDALDFARSLHSDTGHELVRIRAGIHIGPLQVQEEDTFGGTVDFAARVVGAIKEADIWLSERAKQDIDLFAARRHCGLKWEKRENIEMKGFRGPFTLWALFQD